MPVLPPAIHPFRASRFGFTRLPRLPPCNRRRAADALSELVPLKRIADQLQARIHRNYRFVIGFNGALIVLGAAGVLPPATSALLHNLSTLGIRIRSMTNTED